MTSAITTAQTAADLRAAADVIREHGWTQGSYVSMATGGFCMVGAIEVATGYYEPNTSEILMEAWDRRETAYFALAPHTRPGPTTWNDAYDRTAEQVIEKLEQVAAELEEQS